MKAASVAAARSHAVTLLEKASQLGGQARLAQLLPGREEFGGIITNLSRELELSGAEVRTRVADAVSEAERLGPDAVVLATGAKPYVPDLDGLDSAHCVTAWQVLQNEVNPGARVVIADWRADWIGTGLAERLALAGSSVTLCVNAALAGEALQLYARNHYVGRLHKLGITIRTHMRLFGVDEDTVYFQDTLTGEPVLVEDTDTLVLSMGHVGDESMHERFSGLAGEVIPIGDCVAARSAEEAVYEGMLAGRNL